MKLKLILLVALSLLSIGCAEVKQAGTSIGHATRDAAKEIGHGTRDAAKAIGDGTVRVVDEIKEE